MADSQTSAGAGSASTEAAGQGGSGGMPQFDPAYWPGQIAWLLIIFVALYIVLSKMLLPKVGGAIDQREGKIAGDIADARRMKTEAEAQAAEAAADMTEARARSQKLASEAKARAAAEAAARQAIEEAKLQERLSAAEADIAAARAQAMTHVQSIAADTARSIIEKLTGLAADTAEVDAAVSSRPA
jgi:F-type H+-transporting ATPase subunit b